MIIPPPPPLRGVGSTWNICIPVHVEGGFDTHLQLDGGTVAQADRAGLAVRAHLAPSMLALKLHKVLIMISWG